MIANVEPEGIKMYIYVAECLPTGVEKDCLTWRCLNSLQTRLGMSNVNMWNWGYVNNSETSESGEKKNRTSIGLPAPERIVHHVTFHGGYRPDHIMCPTLEKL